MKRDLGQGPAATGSSAGRSSVVILLLSSIVSLLLIAPVLSLDTAELLDRGFGSDDAYYYLQLARNSAGLTAWSQTDGSPVLSADGVHPTNGVQPAWLAVTKAVTLVFGGRLEFQVLLLLAALFHVSAGWFLFAWLRRLSAIPNTVALCASMLWILHPRSMNIALEGTEGGLLALAWAASLYAWCREAEGEGSLTHRSLWLGVALAFGVLVRIDFALLALALSVFAPGDGGPTTRHPRKIMTLAVPWILALLVWLTVSTHTTGSVSLDSGSAKIVHRQLAKTTEPMVERQCASGGRVATSRMPHSSTLELGVKNVALLLSRNGSSIGGFSLLLLLGLGVASFQPLRLARFLMDVARQIWPLFLSFILVATYLLTLGFVRSWYLVPATLLQVIVASLLLWWAVKRWLPARHRKLGGVVLLLLWCAGALVEQHLHPPRAYSGEVQRFSQVVGPLIPSGAIVGSFNSGIPSAELRTQNTVVNLDGVVNHSAARHLEMGTLGEYLAAEDINYLLDLEGTIRFFGSRSCDQWTEDFTVLERRPLGHGHDGDLVLLQRKKSAFVPPGDSP